MIPMRRWPVEAMTLWADAKCVLRLPHVLRDTLAHLVFCYFSQPPIAFDATREESSQGIKLKGLNHLAELLTETIAVNKNNWRSVFTTEDAGIASENEPPLSPAFAHDSLRREVGEICSVISQDPHPPSQFAKHPVSQKTGS